MLVCYVCVVSMLESIKSTAVEKFSHTAYGGGSIVLSLPSRYLPVYHVCLCVCVWTSVCVCVCVCVCVFSEVYQVDKITHLKSRSLNSRLCLHLKWSWLTCFDKNAFHSQCLCTVHVNYHILNEIDRISNFMQWNP